jgi:hypothetical protein
MHAAAVIRVASRNRSPQLKDRLSMDRLIGEVLPVDDLFSLISAGAVLKTISTIGPEFIRVRR